MAGKNNIEVYQIYTWQPCLLWENGYCWGWILSIVNLFLFLPLHNPSHMWSHWVLIRPHIFNRWKYFHFYHILHIRKWDWLFYQIQNIFFKSPIPKNENPIDIPHILSLTNVEFNFRVHNISTSMKEYPHNGYFCWGNN